MKLHRGCNRYSRKRPRSECPCRATGEMRQCADRPTRSSGTPSSSIRREAGSSRRCDGRSRSAACRPPPSRGQVLEPVNRLAVALAVGVVHGGEQVGRPRQLELHDGQSKAGMTLEDAGEDQIAQRQRRIERLRGTAAGVAQRHFAGPADLALPPRRRVQAQRQVECSGGPEQRVYRLVVAPVFERVLGDHRAGEAQTGGAPAP
jgi:hypothetical protein